MGFLIYVRVYFCLRHTKITLVSRIVSINDGLPIGKSKGIFFESFLVMLHFTTDQAGDENEERRFVLYLLPFHIFLALFFFTFIVQTILTKLQQAIGCSNSTFNALDSHSEFVSS